MTDHEAETDTGKCPLCEAAGNRGSMPIDRPWLVSAAGAVLPAKGHLVPGHVLVCSKAHYPNLLSAPRAVAEDVLALANAARRRVSEAFGHETFTFEHGFVGKNTTELGCAIDHIHVHVLPLPDAVLRRAERWISDFRPLTGADDVGDVQRYLIARLGDADWMVSPDDFPIVRRHFLKLIDEELGRTGRYDEVVVSSDELIRYTFDRMRFDEHAEPDFVDTRTGAEVAL